MVSLSSYVLAKLIRSDNVNDNLMHCILVNKREEFNFSVMTGYVDENKKTYRDLCIIQYYISQLKTNFAIHRKQNREFPRIRPRKGSQKVGGNK